MTLVGDFAHLWQADLAHRADRTVKHKSTFEWNRKGPWWARAVCSCGWSEVLERENW